jgi:oxygen-independent coproporphyrinogen-3 oxidase
MYEAASCKLTDAGYIQYEISNWARQTRNGNLMACRHNVQYWRNRPYFGFGAGAHGHVSGFRVANVLLPTTYIERISNPIPDARTVYPQSPATESVEFIDRETEMTETMILGLRLLQEGVSTDTFAERFQVSLEEIYGEKIEKLHRWGLVEWAGDQSEILRLTVQARLVANQVFVEFM